MPNEYHNLRGWLRDLTALLKPGGSPEVLDDLMRVLADLEGEWNYYTGASTEVEARDDDADHTVDDGEGDVEVPGLGDREEDAPVPRRGTPGSAVVRAQTSGMGRELDPRAGLQRAPSQPELKLGDAGGVGAPFGLNRVSEVRMSVAEAQELRRAASVPRGTSRSSKKKGVKRGTRKATK